MVAYLHSQKEINAIHENDHLKLADSFQTTSLAIKAGFNSIIYLLKMLLIQLKLLKYY